MKWKASTYAQSNGETGACVMIGDDTVVDLPYDQSWPNDLQDQRAARIALSVNVCAHMSIQELKDKQ